MVGVNIVYGKIEEDTGQLTDTDISVTERLYNTIISLSTDKSGERLPVYYPDDRDTSTLVISGYLDIGGHDLITKRLRTFTVEGGK